MVKTSVVCMHYKSYPDQLLVIFTLLNLNEPRIRIMVNAEVKINVRVSISIINVLLNFYASYLIMNLLRIVLINTLLGFW